MAKRPSLLEIMEEDEQNEVVAPVVPRTAPIKKSTKKRAGARAKTTSTPKKKKSRYDDIVLPAAVPSKADYVKISPTIPPDMFDQLAMIQLKRRRQKLPFTMSDLIREAVELWLVEQEH